jgi:hypothetical protein
MFICLTKWRIYIKFKIKNVLVCDILIKHWRLCQYVICRCIIIFIGSLFNNCVVLYNIGSTDLHILVQYILVWLNCNKSSFICTPNGSYVRLFVFTQTIFYIAFNLFSHMACGIQQCHCYCSLVINITCVIPQKRLLFTLNAWWSYKINSVTIIMINKTLYQMKVSIYFKQVWQKHDNAYVVSYGLICTICL